MAYLNFKNWYLLKADDRLVLILIGIFVGICSGMAAVALNRSLMFLLHLLAPWRQYPWAFVMPAIGAMLSSLFLHKIVNEGPGHGVPEVVYSVSRYGGLLRFRSSFSRLVSSCLTIGSGGSAGPEAPVVMSGAAIGSNIAKFFALNDRQRVALVGCGAAGAIGAIFNAPVAGMVFSVEVILGEWSTMNIVPIAIAAVAGTKISRLLQGNQIAFAHRQFDIAFIDIIAVLGLALLTALISIGLTRMLRRSAGIFEKISVPVWMRAGIGGSLVGAIGLGLPVVLGEGYHVIQQMIDGQFMTGLGIVTLALVAKMVATSLTLGSGGSGGIFAPCLVIGSFVGLTYHRALLGIWPMAGLVDEGCFALLGMAGMISGMLQAPLTGIFLIFEITGGYEVMLPLIITSAVSATLCHYIEPASFYLRELVEKGQLLRPGTDERVLSDIAISELLETDCIAIYPQMRLKDLVSILTQSHRNYFPVEDRSSHEYLGMVHLDDIRAYLFDPVMHQTVFVEQIMNADLPLIGPEDDLADVLKIMDANQSFSLPVVSNRRFVGMISKATLLDKYRRELMVQTVF